MRSYLTIKNTEYLISKGTDLIMDLIMLKVSDIVIYHMSIEIYAQ